MIVIPAVDISEGQCVRLQQGDIDRKTVFGNDPAEIAHQWANQGAEILHVVDLDGAMGGSAANAEAVGQILEDLKIPVELGGGLRTRDDVAKALDMGVQWAIMGTSALSNRAEVEKSVAEFGDRIVIGIDAKNGKVAVDGWVRTSDVTAIELARQVEALGVKRIIYTDIDTDGMLAGPSIDGTRSMCEAVNMEVTASGGVTTLDDIRSLRMLEPDGVTSCIVGRALYSGTVDLREAIAAARAY